MNKGLLKLALLPMVFASMPAAMTSCKDYDDDINRIDKSDETMKSQIAALESALADAKSAAQTARDAADAAMQAAKDAASKGEDALAAAQLAKAEAAGALEAAQQAKADAIAAALQAIEELKGTIATQDVVDNLANKVSAIDESLSNLADKIEAYGGDLGTLTGTVTAQGNAIEQMQIQLNALNNYKDFLASLAGENGKIAGIEGDIADLDGKISDINDAIDDINDKMGSFATSASVEEVTRTLDSLSETVGKIEGNLVTFLTGRLSSVTLVPSLYVDGIETIEFRSLSYRPKKQGGTTGLIDDGNKDIIVSTKENPAQYRLNPTSTKLDDIDADNIEFVALQATSRGAVVSPIAYVKGSAKIGAAGLEKGILTVNAEKTVTGSLNLSGNQIYTVALKVPIGASHLKDASTPEYVYSEYSRLIESVNTPRIAALLPYDKPKYDCKASAHKHYSDSVAIWKSKVSANELVSVEMAYNQPVDLEKIVTGCLMDIPEEITKEELAKYGMEFRFGLPTKTYNTNAANSTNQQEFITFQEGSKSIVISKTPAGLTDNKAAIDKEPIVRVCLVDTKNNKLVDQRYLKIKWTAVPVADVDLGSKEETAYLDCEGASMKVTWREFVDKIYAQLNMSKEQFTAIYLGEDSPVITAIEGYEPNQEPDVVLDGNVDGDAAVIDWNISAAEIGTIVKYNTTVTPHTWSVDNAKNKYGVKLTFVPNNNDYAKVIFTLKLTIDVKDVPSINGFYENYWAESHKLYNVFPVQYNSQAQKDLADVDTKYEVCQFHNNLMNGFTFANYPAVGENPSYRFIVKGLSSCGTWDMQFCKDHEQSGYAPDYAGGEPDRATEENIGGYNLKKSGALVAQLTWPEGHTAWCKNPEHSEAYANLEKTADGIALLKKASSSEHSAHMGVWATINEYNMIPVHDYNIKFVKPLTLDDAEMNDHFTDGVVSGSRIDWTKAFTLRDCFGYLVAKTTPAGATAESEKYAAELYEYYEVNEPVFDTANLKFGMKVQNGSVVVDPSATAATAMTSAQLAALTTGGSIPSLNVDGDELVFTSNMGSQVGGEFNIWVKVTVTYGWGEESTWVKIPVKPMNTSNPGQVIRK